MRTRWSGSSLGQGEDVWEGAQRWEPFIPRILALADEAGARESARFQAEVVDLDEQAHALQRTANSVFWINHLDDLRTFLEDTRSGRIGPGTLWRAPGRMHAAEFWVAGRSRD